MNPEILNPQNENKSDDTNSVKELHESHVNKYKLEEAYKSLFDDNRHFQTKQLESIDPSMHPLIARTLIEKGKGDVVIRNLSSFKGLDHNETAKLLIEKGLGDSVARNLSSFQGLSLGIACDLIEKDQDYFTDKTESVIRYISSFRGSDHNEIAKLLIEKGLLRRGGVRVGSSIAQHLSSFQGLDHDEIAKLLIKQERRGFVDKRDSVASNLSKFKGLDPQVTESILRIHAGQVAENLPGFRFQGLNPQIAYTLIEKDYGGYVAANLDKFRGLNNYNIAEAIIKKGGRKNLEKLLGKLDNFKFTPEKRIKILAKIDFELLTKEDKNLSNRDYRIVLDNDLIGDQDFMTRLRQISVNGTAEDVDRFVLGELKPKLESLEDGSPEQARILKIMIDMDLTNATSIVSKYMMRKDMPEKRWMYFAKKLEQSGYFTNRISEYIPSPLHEVSEEEYLYNYEKINDLGNPEQEDDESVEKENYDEYLRYKNTSPFDGDDHNPSMRQALLAAGITQPIPSPTDSIIEPTKAPVTSSPKNYNVKIEKSPIKTLKQNNIAFLRQLLARYPNEFNTVIDTCVQLGIEDLSGEKELENAIRDLGSVTPAVYQKYKDTPAGIERIKYAENIKLLKSRLFGNNNLENIAGSVGDEVLSETIYLAYKPTNTSLNGLLEYMGRIPANLEGQMSKYNFPLNGYEINMSNTNISLRKGEQLVTHLDMVSSMFGVVPKEGELEKVLKWIATGASGATFDQMGVVLSLFKDADKSRLSKLLKEAKTDNEKVIALNAIIEACGILAKDTLPDRVKELFAANIELKTSLEQIINNPKYLNSLKARLGEGFQADTEYSIARLLTRSLEPIANSAKVDLKKFEVEGGGKIDNQKRYKYYISKNKGSFFAKASGGVCTADDVDLFAMKDYFHINLVVDDELCLGNVQAYIHDDNKGGKLLILRGFNPSESAFKSISAGSYVEEALRVGKQFAVDNNLAGIAIVYDEAWHPLSNREAVRNYFAVNYDNKGESINIPRLSYNSGDSGTNQVRLLESFNPDTNFQKKETGVTKSHDRPKVEGLPSYIEHYKNQRGRLISGVPTKMLSLKRVPIEDINVKYHNKGIVDYSGNAGDQYAEDYMYVLAEDGDVSLPGNAPHWRAINNDGKNEGRNNGKLFGYETKDGQTQYYFEVNTKGIGFIRREMVDCNDADTLKGVNENGVEINYGLSWAADYDMFDGDLVTLTKKLTEQGVRTELYWSVAEVDAVPFNGRVLKTQEAKEKGVIHNDDTMNPSLGVRLLRSNYRVEEFAKCDEDRRVEILKSVFENFNKETEMTGRDVPKLTLEEADGQEVYVTETVKQYTKNLAVLINNAMTYMFMHSSNLTMMGEIVDMGAVMSLKKTPRKQDNYDARFAFYDGIRMGHIKDMADLCYGVKSFVESLEKAGLNAPDMRTLVDDMMQEFTNSFNAESSIKSDKESNPEKIVSAFSQIADHILIRGGTLENMKYGVEGLPFNL